MASEQTRVLVFKDQAGEYYLLPQDALEHGRVPEEHKAQVERLIGEADDTSGYATKEDDAVGAFLIEKGMKLVAAGFIELGTMHVTSGISMATKGLL